MSSSNCFFLTCMQALGDIYQMWVRDKSSMTPNMNSPNISRHVYSPGLSSNRNYPMFPTKRGGGTSVAKVPPKRVCSKFNLLILWPLFLSTWPRLQESQKWFLTIFIVNVAYGNLGEGNGNPLQYSCLENPMDGGAWQATVHGVSESDVTERIRFLSFVVT